MVDTVNRMKNLEPTNTARLVVSPLTGWRRERGGGRGGGGDDGGRGYNDKRATLEAEERAGGKRKYEGQPASSSSQACYSATLTSPDVIQCNPDQP